MKLKRHKIYVNVFDLCAMLLGKVLIVCGIVLGFFAILGLAWGTLTPIVNVVVDFILGRGFYIVLALLFAVMCFIGFCIDRYQA